MRRILCVLLSIIMVISMASCSKSDISLKNDIRGKTFVWEKDGFGGSFTISLDEGGTFEYYEGPLSSYIGCGNWIVQDGKLIMTESDSREAVFHFEIDGDELVFISSESDKFQYVDVANGDRFYER